MKEQSFRSRLYLWPAFYLIVTLLISTSCLQKQLPIDCERFYDKLNSEEREAEFKTYDDEKQFHIYRCGFDLIPIQSSQAHQIADKGKLILPDLFRRLQGEADPVTKYGIILVFESLAVGNELDDPEQTLQVIESEVDRMKVGWWKDYSVNALQRIKKIIAENKDINRGSGRRD